MPRRRPSKSPSARSRLGIAAIPFLLCFGCGPSTPASSGVTADEACADQARAVCQKVETCTPATQQSAYGDEPTCETRVKAACIDSESASGTGNSPAKTEACAQAYGGYSCADYRNKANTPAACTPQTGSLAADHACLYPAQCQTGFCAIVPGTACGQCAAMPQAGDSCAALTSCGPTLTCTSDTLVCTTPAALGDPCGMGAPCGAGLSCVAPGGVGTAGTCQAAATQPGASCDRSLKTAAACDDALGLYCDGVTSQCTLVTYAGNDGACGYDPTAGTSVACTAGSCQGASGGQLGQCAARAADESACDVPTGGASTPNAGCLPSARCIAPGGATGTCEVVTASACM